MDKTDPKFGDWNSRIGEEFRDASSDLGRALDAIERVRTNEDVPLGLRQRAHTAMVRTREAILWCSQGFQLDAHLKAQYEAELKAEAEAAAASGSPA